MNRPQLDLSADEGLEALRSHLVEKALEARAKYGPLVDAAAIRNVIDDPSFVRFKTEIAFESGTLRPGEFAWAKPVGERPQAGFRLVLHPALEGRPEDWPLCAAYHLVSINYLDVATSAEAEVFGAALFGLSIEAYYERLCAIADALPDALGAAGHHMPGQTPAEAPVPAPESLDPIQSFLAPHLASAHTCGCGSTTEGSCASPTTTTQ